MASKQKYKCPVCKKPLTKKEFERALKIHEAQAQHLEHEKREFAEKVRRFDAEKKRIKKEAHESERARSKRLLAGKDKQLQVMRDRIKQLQRGKTPQEEGPEFLIRARSVVLPGRVRPKGEHPREKHTPGASTLPALPTFIAHVAKP